MITIVDYGLGNIGAFANAYKRMNIPTMIARTEADLAGAERLILPGVGAFDHAMDLLNGSGMRDALEDLVLNQATPVIGVCVGMQMLGNGSDEGVRDGLGWIPGRVRQFSASNVGNDLPLPHMGWNDVTPSADQKLFDGLEVGARFYFLHSYYFEADDPEDISASAEYGIKFACSVRRRNINGVQFHPEKSHHFGARILKNFAGV